MKGAKARELRQAARHIAQTYGIGDGNEHFEGFVRNANKRLKRLFKAAKKAGAH